MASKPKKRPVAKATSETRELPKSPKPQDNDTDNLIIENGQLVENLFNSREWRDIAFPLLQESIAGVSGRLTNNRYYHGSLTRDWSGNNSLFVAGYQKALMDFQNNLHDFIMAKERVMTHRKAQQESKSSEFYNPYLEELNGQDLNKESD